MVQNGNVPHEIPHRDDLNPPQMAGRDRLLLQFAGISRFQLLLGEFLAEQCSLPLCRCLSRGGHDTNRVPTLDKSFQKR